MKKTKSIPAGKSALKKKKSAGGRSVSGSFIKKPFPIAGFGASAGGLESFSNLLGFLDPAIEMAYVLIMHLSPDHKSALSEILQAKTKLKVHTVKDGMLVMPNNIYVIPPNKFMKLERGAFRLSPRSGDNFAIDYFLTSLASEYRNHAIGVILSGTATDGTLGLKAIKAEGGITMAQDDSAKFSGMPRSAFKSGYVDVVLSPEGIAQEFARLVKMPYTLLPSDNIEAVHAKQEDHREDLKKILAIVKNNTGIDFFVQYKHASIFRRVMRRMVLNKFTTPEEYYSMLKANPKEVFALYDDFLINVTNFFRDPNFFTVLEKEIFPSIVKGLQDGGPIRIWVAGCSTGEEAYSVAICLMEFLQNNELAVPIQIFASDIDLNAIEKARLGIYPVSALHGVSQAYIKKYFIKVNGHYQIIKAVREVCVFSQHNLLKDPPFSRLHLISCQNVLIYLEALPQKNVLQTFHYALRNEGFLFLGKSETIGSSTDLFEQHDKKVRIFTRRSDVALQLEFTNQRTGIVRKSLKSIDDQPEFLIEKIMSRILLSQFVHPAVVLNKHLNIIHFFGTTSQFLDPGAGKASLGVLKMVREDLVIELGSLLQQARKTEQMVSREGIVITTRKVQEEITIEVIPKRAGGEIFFLVVFKSGKIILQFPEGKTSASKKATHLMEQRIRRLEEELVQSRGLIRSTHEEYETTYEELQANNEEILSSNEELQSVNEELETSKEELQSANEELTTTNDELRKRNVQLDESQNELKKVNEQLAQFAFISSHDLQEPLRKIATFSDLLAHPDAELNPYAKKYSGKIHASASRMSTLVKDLLTFSVLVKGDRDRFVDVDLNQTLRLVVEDLELAIGIKNAELTILPLPTIQAEPVQMNQLFHNLVSNALKFSREKPVISVLSRPVGSDDFVRYPELKSGTEYACLVVKDNGIGFDNKYVAKMFVIFQQLVKTAEGTGVGLTICKKIVEDHGGFIFADGVPGVGATFTVFLPAALKAEAGQARR